MYALRGREGVKEKTYMYCFYDVILLFKSVQGRRVLKITKFERTYFMDGPISNLLGVRIREILLY